MRERDDDGDDGWLWIWFEPKSSDYYQGRADAYAEAAKHLGSIL